MLLGNDKRRFVIACLFLLGGAMAPSSAALFSGKPTLEEVKNRIEKVSDKKRKKKATLYSELGFLYYKNSRFDEAADAYEKALTFKPNRSLKKHIYRFMGKSYEAHGHYAKAIAAYELSVKYDRKNWKRPRDLATLYERVRLYSKSIEAIEMALKLNPKEATLHASLGRLWRKIGYYRLAKSSLIQANQMNPDDQENLYELSLVHEGLGDFSKAADFQYKTLTRFSSESEWGRWIYLVSMQGDDFLRSKGLAELKNLEVSEKVMNFYKRISVLIIEKRDPLKVVQLKERSMRELFKSFEIPSKD